MFICLCLLSGTKAAAYDAYSVIDSIDIVVDTIYFDSEDFFVDTLYINRLLYYNLKEDGAEVTYVSSRTITAGTIYTSDYYGDIVIPDSLLWRGKTYPVTGISHHAFYDCAELTSVSIPGTVRSIGELAFFQCGMLTSITLPDSLKSIGKDAFYGCKGLTSINIPMGVASISEGAFWTCGSLETITVDAKNSTYDSRGGCNAIIETATNTLVSGCMNSIIPDDVAAIAGYAFANCNGLTSLNLPKGLKKIGMYAFYACEGLTSLVVPDNVTTIGSSAFRECYGLKSYVIGSSVTNISNGAFDVNQPRSMLIRCATPPTIYNYSFSSFTFERTMLYIPAGTLDDYQYSNIWYWFDNICEAATSEKELSEWQAYTLMDVGTFAYTVYDPVGKRLATVSSVSNVNGNNPNHCWQMVMAGGMHFLYNLGAKKYLGHDGSGFVLTDTPEPIDTKDGDTGLVLGGQPSQQWALVCNNNIAVDSSVIDYVTGIKEMKNEGLNIEDDVYNLNGQKATNGTGWRGINIIRMPDGTVRKVLVR